MSLNIKIGFKGPMMVLIIGLAYFENFPINLSTLLDLAEVINTDGYSPAITSFVGSNAGLYTYS